jgi:3-keto-5-aminohexanoate cleavage enzyme
MSKKIIINFCPTGMVPDKTMTPYVPISPDEIIEQTHEAFELGITIAHLHARDIDGKPTWKATVYRDIFEGVRKHCPGLVICGSTSGRMFPEFEKRSEVIELKPDMCSLTLSSLNFYGQASVNEPEMIQKLAIKMQDYGVTPELECFDLGMINYGKYLIAKEIIKPPCYWNLLFGNISGFQANFQDMGLAIQKIPNGHHFSCAGLGRYQLQVNAAAIAMGYGVRVGLEDNIWWDHPGGQKTSNKDLIKRVHNLIEINSHIPLSSKEFGEYGFYNSKR